MGKPAYLITGGSGQLGVAIARAAALREIEIYAPPRSVLDLNQEHSIRNVIRSRQWTAVINCGAYTAVDKAESEAPIAYAVNALAPGIIAQETAEARIPIIHVSTDYVFDGTKAEPYNENDTVCPVSVYGSSKEAGETAVRTNNPIHAIIRTAWVVSAGGANFINTMLKLGAERQVIKVVHDQIGCPSSANDIANALLTVAQNLGGRGDTWHYVNDGDASWYDLAAYVFAETARRNWANPTLMPITSEEYPTPAKRPANSRLSINKIRTDFAITPRPWQAAVEEILAERLNR
jgi:dTDP-4-dehydrorhamnose reductase